MRRKETRRQRQRERKTGGGKGLERNGEAERERRQGDGGSGDEKRGLRVVVHLSLISRGRARLGGLRLRALSKVKRDAG